MTEKDYTEVGLDEKSKATAGTQQIWNKGKRGKAMKKVHTKKIVIVAIVAVLLIVAYLFYSRPMTISQLYPMFTLDKCTEIRGYYEIGAKAEMSEFTIEKDSDEFQKLCALFWEQEYCRSLRDILPRGTRTHRTEPDDYQWDVYFYFEDITLPDGSTGSGAMLHFQSWYGELDIYFDGETYSCHTSEQEAWAKEILDIIQ